MADEKTLETAESETHEEVDYKALYESEKANADKWKAMSRKNEDAYKKATATLGEEAESKISELEQRAQKAEQEAASLRHKQDLAQWTDAAAKEHDVPSKYLHGETMDELMERAKELAEFKAELISSMSVAPEYRDSGNPGKPMQAKSDKAQFVKTLFTND